MEIYAELPKKIQRLLDEDGNSLRFPVGVRVRRQKNSRILMLECEEYMIDMVEELLESSGISFQEMDDREQDEDEGQYDKYGYDKRGNKKKKTKVRPKW